MAVSRLVGRPLPFAPGRTRGVHVEGVPSTMYGTRVTPPDPFAGQRQWESDFWRHHSYGSCDHRIGPLSCLNRRQRLYQDCARICGRHAGTHARLRHRRAAEELSILHHQVSIDADTCLVLTLGCLVLGHRNDSRAREEFQDEGSGWAGPPRHAAQRGELAQRQVDVPRS